MSTETNLVLQLHAATHPEERLAIQRALVAFRLEQDASRGFLSVQVMLPLDADCPLCEPLRNQVVPSTTPAETLIPANCPGFSRRALCHVMTSACIKRDDGTHYFDRASR